MTRMSETQETLISQLEHARVAYESFEATLAAEIADRKWEAKAKMRGLVRDARASGVPYRRIGFAIGSSDHKTLKDYETDTRRDTP